MIKEEIQENNQLIAEFMGWKHCLNVHHESKSPTYVRSTGYGTQWQTIEQMKYHSSWDELMPVIDRLQNVTEELEELDYLKETLWWGTISDVYEEVINCINEYNKKK